MALQGVPVSFKGLHGLSDKIHGRFRKFRVVLKDFSGGLWGFTKTSEVFRGVPRCFKAFQGISESFGECRGSQVSEKKF